jgi:hypothetical protein
VGATVGAFDIECTGVSVNLGVGTSETLSVGLHDGIHVGHCVVDLVGDNVLLVAGRNEGC